MKMKTMKLTLDELDYAAIQEEISLRQVQGRTTTLPDRNSCLAGSMIAEMVRDLREYRDLFQDRRDAGEKP